MARSRKDCLDEIAGKVGRSRKDVEDVLDDILERADQYEHDGMSPDESYAKARDEMLHEIGGECAGGQKGSSKGEKRAEHGGGLG